MMFIMYTSVHNICHVHKSALHLLCTDFMTFIMYTSMMFIMYTEFMMFIMHMSILFITFIFCSSYAHHLVCSCIFFISSFWLIFLFLIEFLTFDWVFNFSISQVFDCWVSFDFWSFFFCFWVEFLIMSPALCLVSWWVLKSIRVSLLASQGMTIMVTVHVLDPYWWAGGKGAYRSNSICRCWVLEYFQEHWPCKDRSIQKTCFKPNFIEQALKTTRELEMNDWYTGRYEIVLLLSQESHTMSQISQNRLI